MGVTSCGPALLQPAGEGRMHVPLLPSWCAAHPGGQQGPTRKCHSSRPPLATIQPRTPVLAWSCTCCTCGAFTTGNNQRCRAAAC